MGDIRLSDFPPPGRLVEVLGSNWHLKEMGEGEATVILEAGVAATSVSWAPIQTEVAKFARVIAYDRAGLGWSDLASTPRTPLNIAEELRALLRAAGVKPPYILAGHSFGGLVASRFAIRHPSDVRGLVLVDALSPDEFHPLTPENAARLKRGIRLSRRGATLARLGVVGRCLDMVLNGNRFLPMLAARVSSGTSGQSLTARLVGEIRKLPRETWPVIAALWSEPKSFEAMAQHLESLEETCAGMSGVKLPEIPITVLTAKSNQYAVGMKLPKSAQQIIADNSGHWVQLDEPELVVEAIREMCEKTRAQAKVDLGY